MSAPHERRFEAFIYQVRRPRVSGNTCGTAMRNSEMDPQPNSTLHASSTPGFLGNTLQAVMIVSDIRRTMDSFARLGIGPWALYTLGPHNVTEGMFRGRPSDAILRVALATVGSLTWELIQPLKGECAQREFLNRHGDGIHHLAVDCNGRDWEGRVLEFRKRGFEMIQSGIWLGEVRYGYFEADDSRGITIESLLIPDGFVMPEPEEWYST
jgi:methylmalonyl-CoA/ethylmalonyl-CoA epimerase